jgi:sugar phosphate permease
LDDGGNKTLNHKAGKLKYYRWYIWGIMCTAYMVSIFHRVVVGSVRNDLVGTFGMSAVTFANLGSTYFYVYLVMQLPSGILADTLGPRITVTLGVFLAGIGSVIFGFSPNIYFVFFGRFIVGLGVSIIYISILKILSEWFSEKEFGKMSGFTTFVGNMGGILTQAPLVLIISVLTWRYTFVMIGILSFIIAYLCLIIIRNKPDDVGLPQISHHNSDTTEINKVLIFRALGSALKNPYTWPPFLIYMGLFGAYQAFLGTWGLSYLTSIYGLDKTTASNYLSLLIIGMSAGSLLIGPISGRLSSRKLPMLAGGITNLLVWTSIVFMNNGKPPIKILAILLFLMGLSYSSVILSFACGKEVNNPKYAGIATSLVNMGGFIGASVIPVILGKIVDVYEKVLTPQQLYVRMFSICLVCVAACCVFLLMIKETGCKDISYTQFRNASSSE